MHPGIPPATSNQGQEYMLTHFLPVDYLTSCDQAHLGEIAQTNLYSGVKTHNLLCPINNTPQN